MAMAKQIQETAQEHAVKHKIGRKSRMDLKAKELAESVLAWWSEHQCDTTAIGDGEWDNVFDETPDFVIKAAAYLGIDLNAL